MVHQHRSLTKAYIQLPFKFPHHHNMFKSKTSQKEPKQQLEAMDETTISLILQACELARDLESNLHNLANQPNLLSNSLDEITKKFVTARERVYGQDPSTSSSLHNMLTLVHQQQIGTSHVQEWLRSSYATQLVADQKEAKIGGCIDDDDAEVKGLQAMDIVSASDTNIASSSSQRARRRKDQGLISKITVPAPRIGNTEIPPEDGFTWRKYGQKEIMGSRFPRSYYRCTHQKLYNCPAKKQVQRLNNDPLTFEVMYRGEHTCHMSATAPSIPPPSAEHHNATQESMAQTLATTTTADPPTASLWLSMDFNPIRGGGGSSSRIIGGDHGGGDGVGTSTTTRYGKEVDFPVVDLADAMFNSGSSSSNSMDFIFHSAENKWESEDKKN
ncbi:PREDICTED: WRKY transcription factor 55 [Prunus mume]|uniref:WRKY transcription factor 55 n=1 Tax=Prunus mume TaxID=102107 RepID=A0ABM0P428_PRUMU|nr:PREDICTED: WRKY transcription factor 55 [Prunus mume]